MATNLTFKYVENLKIPGRHTDALVKGLHIWVKLNLKKYWIFRFANNGKQHNISLGAYPKVSISEARIKAQSARDELDRGSNPITQRKTAKAATLAIQARGCKTFREFSLECLEKKRLEWSNPKHAKQWLYTLEEFAFPVIGDLPVDQVNMEHILSILSPIWATKTETASRLRGRLEWVLAAATSAMTAYDPKQTLAKHASDSTIRMCDLGLGRNRGCWKVYIFNLTYFYKSSALPSWFKTNNL